MNDALFEKVAGDLSRQGYCVLEDALPDDLANGLSSRAKGLVAERFSPAGVGRGSEHLQDAKVRSDSILWIDGDDPVEKRWLEYLDDLKSYLNGRLFLGLFSYESHFAHYAPGAFYEKHVDAFRGQSNRVLSLVTYLNDSWCAEQGGELLIYNESGDEVIKRVVPNKSTLVVFLSEEFPHEVLAADTDRFSIASWFRVNTSGSSRVDPPR